MRFWHSHGLAFGMAFLEVTLVASTASCIVVRRDCEVVTSVYESIRSNSDSLLMLSYEPTNVIVHVG